MADKNQRQLIMIKKDRNASVVQPNTKMYSKNYQILDISDEKERIETIHQEQKQLPKHIEVQLNLKLNRCTPEIREEVRYILIDLLKYPSSEEAQLHREANQLGKYDIKQTQKRVKTQSVSVQKKTLQQQYCKDCGLVAQSQTIPLCTPFHHFPKVGIATYLFFETIKNLTVLVVLLGLVYSVYGLYVNISEPNEQLTWDNYPVKLSYAAKTLNLYRNQDLLYSLSIQGWLLVAVVVVWRITLSIAKFFQIKYERMIDDETITAADFSIMIENIPIYFTKEMLQIEFDKYYQQISNNKQLNPDGSNLKQFKIQKFCKAIPYHLADDQDYQQQLQKLNERIQQKQQLFAQWIEQIRDRYEFPVNSSRRQREYKQYGQLIQNKQTLQKQKTDKIKEHNNDKSQDITTTVFISFVNSQTANLLEDINPQSFSAQIRYYISCCKSAHYFELIDNYDNKIDIILNRAPQPEDIIWQNIGFDKNLIARRKLLTYFILLLILGASFGVNYALTVLQINYNTVVISYAITISLTVVNIFIGIAIQKLTQYEKDFTETNRQISLGMKSVVTQLMNSILVPLISNVYIQDNMYEVDGLVYQVFFLAVSNAFLPPILRFFDIDVIISKLCIFKMLAPYYKITKEQSQLNQALQKPQFQLGFCYIYYIDMFYFTCFYITMQPSIVILTIIGFFFMYWADKHCLLNRSNRPTPSSAMLAEAIGQVISFSPCVLSFGTLVWFNLLRNDFADFHNMTYLSHIAAIGLSALFFIFPFNSIFNVFCHIPDEQVLNYDECRIQLTSEYDRLNPATTEQGIADFLNYLKNHKQDAGKVDKFNLNKMLGSIGENQLQISNIFDTKRQMLSELDIRQQLPQYRQKPTSDKTKFNQSQQNLTMNDLQQEQLNQQLRLQQKDKRIIRNSTPFKPSQIRKNIQTTPKPQSHLIYQDLKGYHTTFVKSKQQIPSNNPYSNIKF